MALLLAEASPPRPIIAQRCTTSLAVCGYAEISRDLVRSSKHGSATWWCARATGVSLPHGVASSLEWISQPDVLRVSAIALSRRVCGVVKAMARERQSLASNRRDDPV